MFLLQCSDDHTEERSWIYSVILGEHLGVPYEIQYGAPSEVVTLVAEGRTLAVDDSFFRQVIDRPEIPARCGAKRWRVTDDGLDPLLLEPEIPVVFGEAGFTRTADEARLSLDVFGSAFFLLSRYEESLRGKPDRHERFPAAKSIAFRHGFLARPVVDEYVEILWSAMKRLWPAVERRAKTPSVFVTCDLDSPYLDLHSCSQVLRRFVKRVLRERRLDGRKLYAEFIALYGGAESANDHRANVDWIMDVNERAGNRVAFNCIPELTHPIDGSVRLGEPRMRQLLRTIHQRGHEIGFHPGYNTFRFPEAFASSVATLRRIMAEEQIVQDELGGRQHYLRWNHGTPMLWESNGLAYDSTMTFADHAGFRCGTCHPFPIFDLQSRRPLKIRERPLIIMESSVIASNHMNLGYTKGATMMRQLKQACRHVRGDFVLLWHNSHFDNPEDRELYLEMIQ